jgi:GDP-L-fucose synthase
MNIFITGSKGFIGSHLKLFLTKKYSKYKIFAPIKEELNLLNEFDVSNFIKKNKIDVIIHLANYGGKLNSSNDKDIVEYNLRIFFNIVKNESLVDKIISFGSGAEYNKFNDIIEAHEEDYLKTLPLDPYGFYKSISSKFIEKSNKIVQLRVFGAYGENEDYKVRFISSSIIKNILKLPIDIRQNVYFDYIYINDLLEIIDWFIHNKPIYKIYNSSTGKKIDLLKIAHMINEFNDDNFKSEIIVQKNGLGKEYTSNNDRLKNEIKNLNFTSHEIAIKKMMAFFKNNLSLIDTDYIIKNKITTSIWDKK